MASKDVFDKLADPKTFTGAHKERFDVDKGVGKGLAGRDPGNEQKVADLSQITRSNLKGKTKRVPKSSGIDLSNVRKFGTQARKAPVIWVYGNGDPHHAGVKITLGKAFNTFNKLLDKLSKDLKLPTGPCKKVYHVVKKGDKNKHVRVTDLSKFKDGGIYLGCGAEKVNLAKYPKKIA